MKNQHNLLQPTIKLVGCFFFIATAATAFAYERVISTTGNASETIAALGLSDKLIAVDTTSVLPQDIMSKKPKIGYRRRLSAEGILSMQPDLLILAPDAGPPTVVEQIKSANTPTVTIGDIKSLDGVIADIKMIAKTLQANKAAKPIIAQIRADERQIKQTINSYPRTPKIVFLMDGGTGKNQLIALGDKTAGDAMITIVGGENVFAKIFKGMKPVSTESMINTDMDIIIIASHGGKKEVYSKMLNATNNYSNLSLTKAAKNHCIFQIGTIESLGFGPSASKAAKIMAKSVATCIKP